MTILKMNGFTVIINIQDEDWMITDSNDPEKGWSRKPIHFIERSAIYKYFLHGLENMKDSYMNEILYDLRIKTFGKNVNPKNTEEAVLFRRNQIDLLDKIANLDLNSSYELSNTIYFVLLPLNIYS